MKYLKYPLILIFVLIAIFVGKGLLTPSITYESEVIVDKSVKESWAVMSDSDKLPEWIKGFLRAELVSGTEGTVGAVSNNYVDNNGQEMMMQETITALTPEEHMAMTFSMDFMDMDYEVFTEDVDGKTTIRTVSTTKGNGILSKSIISFMPGAMKAQEDENLNNLKKVIEENTTNYFPEPIVDSVEVSME